MPITNKTLKTYRRRFAWAFVLSTAILIACWVSAHTPEVSDPYGAHYQGGPAGPSDALVLGVASLVTSVTSLAGLVLTNWLGWRRDRREQKHSDIDFEKKKLELEKLKAEISAQARDEDLHRGETG